MTKKKIFTKKRIIWTIIILLIAGGVWYYISRPKNDNPNIQTATVSKQNIASTVLATGQVISKTDLKLSFQSSGVVKILKVSAGDKVKAGDILGILNQDRTQAALISARGSLAQARANYNKILAGATPEQINIAKKTVESASVAYSNAQSQLIVIKESTANTIKQAEKTLSDLQSPTTQSENKRSGIVVVIAKQLANITSDLNQENRILDDNDLKDTFGVSNISNLNNFKILNSQIQTYLNKAKSSLATAQAYKSDANIYQAVNDTISASNKNIEALNDCYAALQDSITSSKFSQAQLDAYKNRINTGINLENSGISAINSARQALTNALTIAQNAVTNAKLAKTQRITSAENQIASAHASLQQAQARLAQETAKAQPSDIAIARAQITAAQGQVDVARINFNNTVLKSPATGTITSVDTKIGQQVNALQEVIILQDVDSLHAETNVSETNIASLKIGQKVDYTFDALGPDQHFTGKILSIDPAATIISGVVNYLVKTSLTNIPNIKPGMTVNLTIKVASKQNVLAIPSSALIQENNKFYVRIVDNPQTKSYHKVLVTTGLEADGGLIQITSGLKAGQEIVTYIGS